MDVEKEVSKAVVAADDRAEKKNRVVACQITRSKAKTVCSACTRSVEKGVPKAGVI